MKKLKLLMAIILLAFSSCTDNQRARTFGGKEEIILKPNEKLINITWKQTDLWLLTEDTITHAKYFRQSSDFGVLEGEITIKQFKK